MTDPVATSNESCVEENCHDEGASNYSGENEGSVFASTFGNLSGRFQQAMKMATTTTPSSVSESVPSSKHLASSEITKEHLDNDDLPSETESTTTESSDGGLPSNTEEISILEAKVQILFGQLHTERATIKQLKEEQHRTRQEFEIFEKESAECMEELGTDIDDLKDQLQEREDRIKELEALQIIPEHPEGDHEEDLQAELDKLRHQLRGKEIRIGELEARQGGNEEEDSKMSELRSELERMELKLKDKDEMIEKLEESDNLNFSLVEERNEEIERLNSKMSDIMMRTDLKMDDSSSDQDSESSKFEAKVAELREKHKAMVDSLMKELEQKDLQIQECEDSQQKSEKEAASLQETLISKEAQIENWRQRYEMDQEDLSTRVQELTQQLFQRDTRIDELENEGRLNDELIKELEKVQAHGNSKQDGSVELDAEKSAKEDELKKLTRRKNLAIPTLESGGDQAIPTEINGQAESRDASNDDPKSIENLLSEEKALREEMKSRVKALTRDMRNRDSSDDDSSAASSTVDLHTFYFHLSQQVMAIVGSLQARDGISNDLIKAFQLKLEYTSSLERQLEAREAQLEMLVQELDDLEAQNKDNLGTSVNSTSSNHTLLVSSKLEELLIDLHERDEKLKCLEWLTADLSKTLEKQTDEYETYREKAERKESKQQKKIERLHDEIHDREVEVQGLKTVLENVEGATKKCEEVEARLSEESSHRQGLQSTIESLKTELCDSQRKVKVLQMQLDEKKGCNEAQVAELEGTVSSLKDHLLEKHVEASMHKETQIQEQHAIIESLTQDLRKAENKAKALEVQVQSNRHDEAQKEGLQELVNSLAQDQQRSDGEVAQLQAEIERKDKELASQRDELEVKMASLLNELHEATHHITRLETEMEAKNSFISLRESQMEGVSASLDDERCQNKEANIRISVLREELEERYYEVETLVCVLARHEQCINCMEDEREASIGALRDSANKASSLQHDLQMKEQIIGDLKEENTKWTRSLEKQVQEMSNKNMELERAKIENTKLNDDLRKLCEQNSKILCDVEFKDTKLGDCSKLEDQLAELEIKRGELRFELKHQTVKLEEAKKIAAEYETLKQHHERLQLDLENLKAEGEAAILSRKVDEVEQKNVALLEDLRLRQQELENAANDAAEQSRKLEALEDQNSSLQSKLESVVVDTLQDTSNVKKQLDELIAERDSLLADLKVLKRQLDDMSAERAALLDKLVARDEQSASLQCQLESIVADSLQEKSTLKNQLDTMSAERAALLDNLMASNERLEEASKCAAQMQELKELNATHLEDLKAWEGRVNELERLVASKDEVFQEMTVIEDLLGEQKLRSEDLLGKIDSLNASLEQKEKELQSVKADKAQNESQLQSKYELLQGTCAQLEKELRTLTERCGECTDKLQKETKLLTTKVHDYNELEGRYEEAETERKRLSKQIESLRQACLGTDGLESRVESSQAECTRKQAQIHELMQRCSLLEHDLKDKEEECSKKEEEIIKLTQRGQDHSELERQFVQEMKSLSQDLQRIKAEAEENETAIKDSVEETDEELESLRAINKNQERVIEELQAQCRDFAWFENEVKEKRAKCMKLEKEVEDLTQDLECTRIALADAQAAVQRSSSTDGLLRQEVRNLQQEVNDLDSQIDKLSGEKAALVDEIAAIQQSSLKHDMQDHQMLLSQMASMTEVLEERQKQLDALHLEKESHELSAQQLRQKIDEQANDIGSLLEEHETECTELRERLDSMTGELQVANLRLMEIESEEEDKIKDIQSLELDLLKVREESKSMQMENNKVQGQLAAIGFESMDALVRGLVAKSKEHDEMQKIIHDRNKKISTLKRELQEAFPQTHKIRELEMKMGIFRDEIAGKNAIIEDLTLRLHGGDASVAFLSEAGTSISTKDAPGLRMKRVACPPSPKNPSNTKQCPASEDNKKDAEATAKALATIPELIDTIKERDFTIKTQRDEIAASKRAIEGLVKGLEYNVQEKIEADRLAHEKKTQVNQFASRVQRLKLKLNRLEEHQKRPMKRNLAQIDDIKSLSVDELVELLRQSRLLAEDLTDERERLIANATNMSIALAESRSRVEELMQQLEPPGDTPVPPAANHEPSRSQSRASKNIGRRK